MGFNLITFIYPPQHKMPMLLVGPTGTGKSFYIQNISMNKLSEEFLPAFITFTVMITANQTQELIMSKVSVCLSCGRSS